jgi:phosphoglycolate phosphatase
MNYAAVLFDLDGTLLDTLGDLADAMNAVLGRLGCPPHPPDAYRFFVGEGIYVTARRALPADRRGAAEVERAVALMGEEYERRWAARARPYPGIPELLDALAARGVQLAVLSNKPDVFSRRLVARFLGEERFAAVQGAREGVPVKPDPAAPRAIAAALGVAPERWLYLGDTGTDMMTAVAAGMYPVGAAWGFRPAAELLAHGARKIIDRPEELLGLL